MRINDDDDDEYTAATPPVACVRIGSCTDQRQGRIVIQSPPQLLFLALVQCTIESPPAARRRSMAPCAIWLHAFDHYVTEQFRRVISEIYTS